MDYSIEKIGRNLKRLRQERHWKFSYIEKNTGISVDRLKKLEAANGIATYYELFELSRLYDLTIDDLVFTEV